MYTFTITVGWKSLKDSVSFDSHYTYIVLCYHEQVERLGSTNQLSALVPKLTDIDPDDAFSTVPYEKGFSLLYQLELLVGLDSKRRRGEGCD